MSEFMIQETTLKGIADAIREKNKTTDEIAVADMPAKIKEVPHGMLDTSLITDWSRYCRYGSRHETVDYIDTSNGTIFTSMFENFTSLGLPETGEHAITHIPVEKLNTSNGELFDSFCSNNKALTEIASFDTSKAELLSYCFENCPKLQNAPLLNTPLCTDFSYMYYNCAELKDGGVYDMTSINNTQAAQSAWYMFAACDKLEKLKIKIDEIRTSNMTRMFLLEEPTESFTDFEVEVVTENGGIKVDDNSFNLSSHIGLSVESLLSVLNALKDNTGESTTYNIYLGSNINKLSAEQKQIVFRKNINLK